jgi:hypothetical protein
MNATLRTILFALILGTLPLCACDEGGSFLRVIRVPSDAATPQQAMDMARPGDVVLLESGVHSGAMERTLDLPELSGTFRAVCFAKDQVQIVGSGNAVLQGESPGSIGIVAAGVDVLISDLTFQAFSTGVLVRGGEAKIYASTFAGCDTAASITAGEAGTEIENCTVTGCRIGLHLADGIVDTAHNTVVGCETGFLVQSVAPLPGGSRFSRNGVSHCDTGYLIRGPGVAGILRNRIHGCDRAVVFDDQSQGWLWACDLEDNRLHVEIGRFEINATLLQARWCWWGTTDPDSIAARILDHEDDPQRPYTVRFEELVDAPPSTVDE